MRAVWTKSWPELDQGSACAYPIGDQTAGASIIAGSRVVDRVGQCRAAPSDAREALTRANRPPRESPIDALISCPERRSGRIIMRDRLRVSRLPSLALGGGNTIRVSSVEMPKQ